MLKMNYKKALLAATVLTAFCANAAFANETPDKPTMRERVNKILKCEDRVDCNDRFEQRKARFEKRKEAHQKRVEAKMNKLTPEQRQEVEDFIKNDREFHKAQMERMKKHHEAQREELRDMSKEQREAIRIQQPPKKFGKHHKDFRR